MMKVVKIPVKVTIVIKKIISIGVTVAIEDIK